jgi:tripartite-type tricarboxylate transporter receptor subunit TctC
MNTTRRQALATGAVLLTGGLAPLARAQGAADGYPSGAVKIVVGFSAGGPTDLAARLVAAKLQQAFGQSFLVDNKPGAGSNLASGIVADAAPDGATLLMAAAPLAINNHLYKGLKWNVLTSFAPITQVMSAPCILAVRGRLAAPGR